jgi:hypothetical protein
MIWGLLNRLVRYADAVTHPTIYAFQPIARAIKIDAPKA